MPKLEVFDPPLCCPTGVCGTSVDPVILRFAGALAWLRRQGVDVERRNLAQEPAAFEANGAVRALLAERGDAALPAILVDGRVVASGRYPTKEELATAVGVSMPKTLRTLPSADGAANAGANGGTS